MSKYYEVVIFTAALQDYADWALDQIDTGKWITHRLYRQHTMPSGTVFLKDLSRLGRDLTKTIIADNVAENFSLQNDNGIFVKTWFDDPNDVMLESLAPLLREIVVRKVKDVRAALRNYRDQFLRQIIQGVQNPLSNLSLKR
jgi:CTD small phosphatase-like protein 2